jgi:hypothetical protein
LGLRVAAISCLLLAINRTWIESSSLVACETLLGVLCFVGWWLQASFIRESMAKTSLVGFVFGLAYLAKASAAFPLFLLMGLSTIRGKTGIRVAVFLLAGFVVGAGPLLIRNIVQFGQPLHSFNNKLLFADSFEQGIAEPDLGLVGNAKRFLSRHSMKEIIVDRLVMGTVWETFVLFRSLGPWPLDSGRALVGFLMFLLAILGFVGPQRDRLAPIFLLTWTAWSLVFFGWYQPIASGDRFLIPVLIPLLVSSASGLTACIGMFHHQRVRRISHDVSDGSEWS